MIGKRFGERKFPSRGMYIRSTSDILPKWNDMRTSYIPPKWNDMRSIADIPKLYEIRLGGLTKDLKTDEKYHNEG